MLKRLFRKSLLATAVSGVGVLALTMGPAAAAPGAALGLVHGSVTVTGLSVACAHQEFDFAPITLAGAVVSGTQVAVGTITTHNSANANDHITGRTTGTVLPGAAGCAAGSENLLSATGVVDGFNFGPSAIAPPPVGAGVGAAVGQCGVDGSAGAAGNYQRIGGLVVVSLGCRATVNGASSTQLGMTVVAWFQPNNPAQNGVTVPVTTADFAGVFAGVGAA